MKRPQLNRIPQRRHVQYAIEMLHDEFILQQLLDVFLFGLGKSNPPLLLSVDIFCQLAQPQIAKYQTVGP